MKRIFSFLLLVWAVMAVPVFFTSCDKEEVEIDLPQTPQPDPEPEKDKFENLYGYWINSDYSGAMEFSKYNSSKCKVTYFVYTPTGLETISFYYEGGSDNFGALTPDGVYTVSVWIISSTLNKLVLQDSPGQGKHLSSYIFTRVGESKFYDYLEGKNSDNGDNNDEQEDGEEDEEDDAKKLIGTWVGYDGTPGLEWTGKYTITFYSTGKAKEVYSYSDGSLSYNGTYKYSNGKITEWKMSNDGGALIYAIGDPSDDPWTVTFNSPTEMTIGYSFGDITFTKQ